MEARSTKREVWQRWRQLPRMDLLATYEDSSAQNRVKEFCAGLSRDLGPQCHLEEHTWPFSTLRMTELRQIAAEEASASDVVIVSAHRSDDLPSEVKDWVERLLQRNPKHSTVLLALLDPDYEGASTAVQSYLQDVARRGGMDFLVLAKDAADSA